MAAANNEPFSVLGADYESSRLEPGNDNDAVTSLDQILRNALVGSRHDFREDRRRLAQPPGRIVVDR